MGKIECRRIAKSYDGETNVLEGIDLSIEEGEFFILVGPSGCGKSTLLRIIAGLEDATSGELILDGRVANDLHPKDRHLSMVFQNYALFPHMSVRENILFGLDVQHVSKSERETRLAEAARLLGLEDYLDRRPRELSGGQRQRVALARSVCSRAPICLMDEPLSNLDAKLRASMRTEIRRIQRELGLTVVYVTHDQVEAMTMGDRIAVLSGGAIEQMGSPLEVYNRPANEFVATFIGTPQMNMADAVCKGGRLLLNGALSVPLAPAEAERFAAAQVPVRIGIRPEGIAPARADDPRAVSVRVVGSEMMGSETLVSFAVGEGEFSARWTGQHPVETGSDLHVLLDPAHMHLFGSEDGRLISPAVSGAAECGLA